MADRPAFRPAPTSFPTFSLAERDRRWNLARAFEELNSLVNFLQRV